MIYAWLVPLRDRTATLEADAKFEPAEDDGCRSRVQEIRINSPAKHSILAYSTPYVVVRTRKKDNASWGRWWITYPGILRYPEKNALTERSNNTRGACEDPGMNSFEEMIWSSYCENERDEPWIPETL